jgi:nucleoside-diphosphate-sugar epimerase
VKTLVVGGTGFLGPFIVDELLRHRHEVATLGMDWRQFSAPVTELPGAAADGQALRGAVSSWRPDKLIDMERGSADRAEAVIAACAGQVSRSVHLSSGAVYGSSPICPVDEMTATSDSLPPDLAAQAESDRTLLAAAERGELRAVVMRLPELYGPRDPRGAEWFFAKRALDGRTRIALPDAGLHICHRGFVQSMAWGVAQAACVERASGVYNLGEEKLYTLAQLARGVARALDHEWEIYSVPGQLWAVPYACTRFFDLRKARAQLRYEDRMIPRDGLELTLAWLCQNPKGEDWSWPGVDQPFDYAREDALIDEFGVRLEA